MDDNQARLEAEKVVVCEMPQSPENFTALGPENFTALEMENITTLEHENVKSLPPVFSCQYCDEIFVKC